MLLQGDSLSNICEISRKSWGVSTSQVYRYAQRARALIKKEAARIREEAFDEHLVARRRMRKDAHDADDKRLAFDILKDETKLLDLYPADRHKVYHGLTDDDLDIAIATELARLAGTSPETALRTAEDDADPIEAEP